ncbi:twin-arginine translocation signal domain-containing protein [Parapedobacter tibetensis]|nr:twin-arginine translocation signal domain-containing protein [Parapedobacter tibetensis]
MKESPNSRRDFIKKTAIGAAALSFGGVLSGFSAKSYAISWAPMNASG